MGVAILYGVSIAVAVAAAADPAIGSRGPSPDARTATSAGPANHRKNVIVQATRKTTGPKVTCCNLAVPTMKPDTR